MMFNTSLQISLKRQGQICMYISISEFVVRKTLALCYTFEHLLSVHRRHQTKLCRIKGLSVNTCRGHSEETVHCGAKSRVQLKKKVSPV